mgnify:CR=1 FL=1|tara:strand:+ start:71 stop:349 length:279 start_codon:yes stop_codon:yes gene_type:complete
MQTLRQFEDAYCATVCFVLEENGITRAEYMHHYPYGSRVDLWYEYLERETREGNPITRDVERWIRDTNGEDRADRQLFLFAHNVEMARRSLA